MLELAESILSWSCGMIVVIWISIGTLARSVRMERIAHNAVTLLCFLTAAGLIIFDRLGEEFWDTEPLANFLALMLVILGIVGQIIPIRGEEIQGEPNPHHLMKARKERESEE